MGAARLSQLDSAVAMLEKARALLQHPASEPGASVLNDAFAAIGALYAELDGDESREVSSHRSAVYDCCLQQLGEARPGHVEGLQLAINLLIQLRQAEESAPSEPRIRRWP
jgi:flagellin-specific chaperone FliS